jgi:hypothetical protein
MISNRDRTEKYSFYQTKCSQHLHRARLSLRLAVDHIKSTKTNLREYREEAEKCGLTPTNILASDMISIAIKTHFLLLKVNFEFFLNHIIYSACDQLFDHLVKRKGFVSLFKDIRKDIEMADLLAVIATGNVKEYVLSKVVPQQGLDRFEAIVKDGLSLSLSDILGEKAWHQIYCAFELRHLIEHQNGRIDSRFKRKVNPHWRKSSWQDVPLDVGAAIKIREVDFEQTFEAMLSGVDAIGGAITACRPVQA